MAPEEGRVKESKMQQQQQQKFDGEKEEDELASACFFASAAAREKSSDIDETEELIQFDKSLQELREIRSQLHYAADYCETTFLNSEDKKPVVENTKEYICRAMVTVVDHLGSVSSSLASRLSQASSFTDTELRLDSLKQRILSCERLGSEFALTKVRWRAVLLRQHPRYLFTDAEKPNVITRDSVDPTSKVESQDHKFHRDEGLPLFLYTQKIKPSLGDSKIVPIRDGFSVLSKGPNPTFHFQADHKLYNGRNRRSLLGSDIVSLIRRVRRMGRVVVEKHRL